MAYGSRRPVIAYARAPSGAAGGASIHRPNTLSTYRNNLTIVLIVTILYTAFLYRSGGAGARSFFGMSRSSTFDPAKHFQITTFNIAAINNNPFEYWLTIPEYPEYEKLMVKIENFLENPGEKDVLVPEVFTKEMFRELDEQLTSVGWKSTQTYWDEDFSKRTIVEGFLKDPTLGSKRLASMPDRVTNVITTADGTSVYRPTVISMYGEPLNNQEMWWKAWNTFMFKNKLSIKKSDGVIDKKAPWGLLKKISKVKYPDITEEEEADSLPLQTLCGAILDAILVHMMNTVSEPSTWQPLKSKIVENLNQKKVPHTLAILENQYIESDIMTLQEVSTSFVEEAKKGKLGKNFIIITPREMDAVRDQNSIILLNKATFSSGSQVEITDDVKMAFGGKDVPVEVGDILAVKAESKYGDKLVIASFHGDTNGLATKPVLDAVMKVVPSTHRLIFGLDANTYERAKPKKQQDVMEWGEHYVSHGLTSCWGDVPQKSNYTTYNARTYLQPQLNKACKSSDKRAKGDINPKDFIVFGARDFEVVRTWKDNTGEGTYKENMAFPTLKFPSDHGILTTILKKSESNDSGDTPN